MLLAAAHHGFQKGIIGTPRFLPWFKISLFAREVCVWSCSFRCLKVNKSRIVWVAVRYFFRPWCACPCQVLLYHAPSTRSSRPLVRDRLVLYATRKKGFTSVVLQVDSSAHYISGRGRLQRALNASHRGSLGSAEGALSSFSTACVPWWLVVWVPHAVKSPYANARR